MIEFIFEADGSSVTLPINPPVISLPRDSNNKTSNVVGLGDITIIGSPKLYNTKIESYFPSDGVLPPEMYVEFFDRIWRLKQPIRYIITGINKSNMLVSIQNFKHEIRAGEEEDIYYTLELVEYVPYGARIIEFKNNTTATPVAENRPAENAPIITREYTVVKGDTLLTIAKKQSGSESKWEELYEANKIVIGNKPNLISVGIKLKIPESWVTSK